MNNTKQAILARRVTARPYVRSNDRFFWLLHEQELTVEMLAELAGTGRTHLNQVLNNKPGRGHFTRKKLVALIWTEPHRLQGEYILTEEMLKELGWDRQGRILNDAG